MSAVAVYNDESNCQDDPRGSCPTWCPHHGNARHEASNFDHQLDFPGVPASHSPVVDKYESFEMARVGVGVFVDTGASLPATEASVTLELHEPTAAGDPKVVTVYLASCEARRVAALLIHGADLLDAEVSK